MSPVISALLLATNYFLFVLCEDVNLDMLDEIVDAEDKCFAEYPSITKDFVEGIKESKKFPDNVSGDFKCFLHCVGLKINKVFVDDHEFHAEGLKDLAVALTGGQMTKDEAHRIVTKCIPPTGLDPCEAVWLYVDCKLDELQPYEFHTKFCQNC